MEETRWKEKNQYLGLTEDGRRVRLLDQSQLPNREVWLELEEPEELAEAIRTLRVRGAPAIGVFAAYALYVLARRLADRAPGGGGVPYPAAGVGCRPGGHPAHGGEPALGAGADAGPGGPDGRAAGADRPGAGAGVPGHPPGGWGDVPPDRGARSDPGRGGGRHPDPLQRRGAGRLPVRHRPGSHPAGAGEGKKS